VKYCYCGKNNHFCRLANEHLSLLNKPRSLLLFIKDELMICDTNAVFKEPTCVQSAPKIVYFWDIVCKFDLKC